MKKTILILLTVVLLFPLYAQTGALGSNTGYYVNDNFVSWKVDSTSIILLSDDSYIDSCVLSLSEIFNQENESIVFSDEDNSIQTALREGRDGKGCVVVASSGNERKTDNINHIAKIPGVIGVGGLMGNGRRGEYSNCSSELSLMAFGGQVVQQDERGNYCDIRTIDREGNNGYNTGNYCTYFGMTSAAAPMVSGVASLMLSVNPELTSTQVKNIMENTAKEWEDYNFSTTSAHPNGSWNAEVGYGLVDAHKAVVHAYEYGYDMKIVGSDELADCDNREYTCDILRPELFTYEWNCSNNLVKVSEDGATAHFMPLAVGVGMVTVNVKQQDEIMFSLNKEVTISSISVNISPVATADFSVTSDATWSASTYLPVEVTVESGSTLTITGTLHCAPNARIIVRPGARLVVDGGTLTGACDNDLWEGIFVEGNPSPSTRVPTTREWWNCATAPPSRMPAVPSARHCRVIPSPPPAASSWPPTPSSATTPAPWNSFRTPTMCPPPPSAPTTATSATVRSPWTTTTIFQQQVPTSMPTCALPA